MKPATTTHRCKTDEISNLRKREIGGEGGVALTFIACDKTFDLISRAKGDGKHFQRDENGSAVPGLFNKLYCPSAHLFREPIR